MFLGCRRANVALSRGKTVVKPSRLPVRSLHGKWDVEAGEFRGVLHANSEVPPRIPGPFSWIGGRPVVIRNQYAYRAMKEWSEVLLNVDL